MNKLKGWQRNNYYKELVYQGTVKGHSDPDAPRLVILVRDDILPPLHQGIQAMHAVIALSQSVKLDPRCYLILLGATREQISKYTARVYRRKDNDINYAIYSDPGLVDPKTGKAPVTACAFSPMTQDEVRDIFGGLKRAE